MKNTNRKRTLLISGAIILLCMIIIVSTSWALFTDRKAVTTHLRAGDLEITLERIGLSKSILNEKGYLEVKEYTPEEAYFDFSPFGTSSIILTIHCIFLGTSLAFTTSSISFHTLVLVFSSTQLPLLSFNASVLKLINTLE